MGFTPDGGSFEKTNTVRKFLETWDGVPAEKEDAGKIPDTQVHFRESMQYLVKFSDGTLELCIDSH